MGRGDRKVGHPILAKGPRKRAREGAERQVRVQERRSERQVEEEDESRHEVRCEEQSPREFATKAHMKRSKPGRESNWK